MTAFVSVLELDYRRRRGGRLDCLPCFDLENIPPEPKRDFVRSFVKKYFIPVIFYPVT